MADVYNFSSRHLAESEAVTDLLHQYGANILGHVATLTSDCEISRSVLNSAIEKLAHFQPALRMRIHTEQDEFRITKRFEELDCVEVTVRHLELMDKANIMLILEEELCRPFQEGGPLWRVAFGPVKVDQEDWFSMAPVTPQCHMYTVIFLLHHVIADHVSILDLVGSQFRRILAAVANREKRDQFLTPTYMLPAPDTSFLDTRVAMRRSAGARQRNAALKKKRESSMTSRITSSLSVRSTGLSQRASSLSASMFSLFSLLPTSGISIARTRLHTCDFGQEVTSNLVESCDRHHVTVQQLMTMAARYAFGVTCSVHHVTIKNDVITCCHPLDLRHFRPIGGAREALGCWSCHAQTRFRFRPESPSVEAFWDEVIELSASLKMESKPWQRPLEWSRRAMTTLDKQLLLGASDAVPEVPKAHVEVVALVKDETSRRKSRSLNARSKSNKKSTITATECRIVTSLSDFSCSPLLVSATVFHDVTTVTIAWNDNRITDDFAMSFAGALVHITKYMSAGGARVYTGGVGRLPPYLRAQTLSQIDAAAEAALTD